MSIFKEGEHIEKTQIEHIRHRPEIYLGGNSNPIEKKMYIYEDGKIVKRKIKTSITFINAINEIYTNAIDQAVRTRERGSKIDYVKRIELTIMDEEIHVINDGFSIGIKKNENNIWIPEAIYTIFRAGRNFDDSKKRYVGGKNGYGAALATACSDFLKMKIINENILYIQKIKCNGSEFDIEKPILKNMENGKNITHIVFRISEKMSGKLKTKDILPILKRRCLETQLFIEDDINVIFNKKKISENLSIEDFVYKYISKGKVTTIKSGKINDFIYSYKIGIWTDEDKPNILSYVNGINTSEGGTHEKKILNVLVNEICKNIKKFYNEKNPERSLIKKNDISKMISMILITFIDKPNFNTQSKSKLTTQIKLLPDIKIDKKDVKEILNNGLMKKIKKFVQKKFAKKRPRVKYIAIKNYLPAAKKKDPRSTLILTEGDSATTQAEIGLDSLSDNDSLFYGIYTLTGKPLNAQTNTVKKVANNVIINNIGDIIGINDTADYSKNSEFKKLKYQRIIIFTDADSDGYHIAGLINNIMFVKWKSLFSRKGFLHMLRSPCIRLYKNNKIIKEFWTLNQFNIWNKKNNIEKSVDVKYFKGIGKNSKNEISNIIQNMDKNISEFVYSKESDKSMNDFFGIKSDSRKIILNEYDKNLDVIYKNKTLYEKFNKEQLVQYFYDSSKRSIPQLNDGLKPVQRSILWYMMNNDNGKYKKVIVLTGNIMSKTCYPHGNKSLSDAISRMAQKFTNANNLNLLDGTRGFGSRRNHNFSQPRYAETKLCKYTRLIFRKEDDEVLEYVKKEGKIIEPKYYIPIIPMILVNGAQGIGTGHSSTIAKCNPLEIIQKIKDRLMSRKEKDIFPWYIDYGNNDKIKETKKFYETSGSFKYVKDKIFITELPIKRHEKDFQEHLNKLQNGNNKKIKYIKSWKRIKKNKGFIYEIKFLNNFIEELKNGKKIDGLTKIIKLFGMIERISKTNMTLFDSKDKIVKFKSLNEIFDVYYKNRIELYKKRKIHILNKLMYEILILECKQKFIELYIDGTIKINKEKISHVIKKIDSNIPNVKKTIYHDKRGEYYYLYNMPIFSLTEEKIEFLKNSLNKKRDELEKYKNKTIKNIWLNELELLEEKI
jgi:DNA topoisomerase-2